MNGRKIGSLSLRLDAAYCAAAAILVATLSPWLADMVGVSTWAMFAIALVVAAWAAALRIAPPRIGLRPTLIVVMSANFLAALGIGLLALTAPNVAVTILVAAVAVEVAAFAVSQAVSLRTI